MDNREQQARREARKKRRRRNQIMVYAVFLILILAIGTGMGFGVFALMKNRKAADEKEQDNQELIEEMLATEESIPSVEPTPDPTPEAPEPTREERLDAYVDERIAAMPLEDKVAGLFVVTPGSDYRRGHMHTGRRRHKAGPGGKSRGRPCLFCQEYTVGRATERNAWEYGTVREVSPFHRCG